MRAIKLILVVILLMPLLVFVNTSAASSATDCKHLIQQKQLRFVNKKVIQSLFEAENAHIAPNKFPGFFAKHYKIIDVGAGDVPKSKAGNIVTRIAAFQKAHPNYQVKVLEMIASKDKVFVQFVATEKGKTLLMSFTIFTLKNGKITKVVELVRMY